MKRLVLGTIMALLSIVIYAQKDVSKFLGIPVDGYKTEMKQKLIAKGYNPRKVGKNEFLEGEFNGVDVHIYIATNNNKVYRIMVCDVNTLNEADIKTRFNRLVSQFENNKRYASLNDYTIKESEDISYEMTVNNKNYEALFYQKTDTLALKETLKKELLKTYTAEQLENPTEEISKEAIALATRISMDIIFKKPVWFRICENYGEYYISIYYDNEYNHADGEDL